MEEEKLQRLKSFEAQIKNLRKDHSLLTGITFNTLAGDIRISRKEIVLFLIDSMIKYLKDEIKYTQR